jgi:hypothetical protein
MKQTYAAAARAARQRLAAVQSITIHTSWGAVK